MSEIVVATRPTPGEPRPYHFPSFERHRLSNGLTVITIPIPGRPLVSTALVIRNGAVDEPAAEAGSTALAARALSEGTADYDAIALVEASERLGASLHAETSWDSMTAGVEVPSERLDAALSLLAEMVGRPTFPGSEVERLRDERLNDILQARADPRRRVDEAFVDTIYTVDSPYHRPAAGTRETVAPLGPADLRRAWERGMDPARTTLVVGGDLTGLDVPQIAERLFGVWRTAAGAAAQPPIVAQPGIASRLVRLVHRPGAVQTEIRVGHAGLPRHIPDYHALSVMSAILGGLFNSRLNRNLREDKGYTYGAGAGFDLRRAAGPFSARAAVNTEVTVPAIREMLLELERIRTSSVSDDELAAGRDFLIGVFPLRFETPGPVVGSVAGLVVHDLPDDELATYRAGIEAVTADDVLTVAREHIRLDEAAIVLVGDADKIGSEVEASGFGPLDVVSDEASPTD
ncbi:MAG TPA: pitrilysin family protein [Candidatus Acidoferrum sp.]|nr:pitrilysin family protein [Candidatus Acidoferrum sp.]